MDDIAVIRPIREPLSNARAIQALEDGEALEIVYLKGSQPGTKRLIIPKTVRGHLLYAIDTHTGNIKSFVIATTLLCTPDDPAEPFKPRTPAKRMEDPAGHFAAWEYDIRKELWPALGVTLRQYIDKPATKEARSRAQERGLLPRDIKRIKVRLHAYAFGGDHSFAFAEGDTFFHRTQPLAVQVVRTVENLEIHLIFLDANHRIAYRVSDDELAEWLQTGTIPEHARLTPLESAAPVLFRQLR